MKKQILSTSAIALGVAMAAPASAQEWNLDWGGFFNTHVGISDVDENVIGNVLPAAPGSTSGNFDGVDVFTNAEIIFTPSVTLDNGMTFGANIQLEALNSGGARVDESYMSISSDTLGRIDLGAENSAGYKLMVGAPQVAGGIGINSPSVSAFIPLSASQFGLPTTIAGGLTPVATAVNGSFWNFRQAAISSYTEVAGNNDVQRITYYTPSFNGLTLGVSYAASGAANAANNGAPDRNGLAVEDIFDIGANYSQSFNGVDINIGARWGTANTNAVGRSDPETWGVGATIGVAGFTFGGSYAENDNGFAPGAGFDEEGWSLGVTYDLAGPWSVGFDTYQGETSDNAGFKTDYEAYQLVGSRSLGAGVTWAVYAAYAETSLNSAYSASLGSASDLASEGTMVGTSINLSF